MEMKAQLTYRSWRYLGLALIMLSLLAAAAYSIAAHAGTAQASHAPRTVDLGRGHASTPVKLGGTVDLSKLPILTPEQVAAHATKHPALQVQGPSTAQQQAFARKNDQHKLPLAAGQAVSM